jgi:hypothetical protein
MLKRIGIGIVLLWLCCTSGCAAYVAGIDCDAALKVAAAANTVNLKALAAARIREHDKSLEEIEAIFESQLAKVTNGAQAIQELTRYRATKARAEAAKGEAGEKIQRTLNTAFWLESLVDRRIGLRAQWDTFFGRFPAVSEIKTLAEAKIREYMSNLNKGMNQ